MKTQYDNACNVHTSGFRKITSVNGFDPWDPDNAMQNNYAWSMTEMDGYLYVGTARNIPYSIITLEVFGDIPAPPELTPKNPVMAGEIWRYPLDGSGEWERVYRTPEFLVNLGFRFMITYTTPSGETAIYAGALTLTPELFMLKSTDGIHWDLLETGIEGFSTRYMAKHRGKLYMGALPLMGQADLQLFSSFDPQRDGWEQVDVYGEAGKNPRGNVDLLLSHNGHLYVGTGLHTGFEFWRTLGTEPERDQWKLVVDRGAGDARNEHPWAVAVFNDQIYIGTAIEAAVLTLDPDKEVVPPKAFDVIRVDQDDRWELLVGGRPVVPTEPTTGTRTRPLSGFLSGFGNISNAYCWQLQAHGDELFLGTFSWSVMIPPFIPLLPEIISRFVPEDVAAYESSVTDYVRYLDQADPEIGLIPPENLLEAVRDIVMKLGRRTFGFDLWKTRDGIHWLPVSLNGLGNPYNYGVRMLYRTQDEDLFLGTANPFEGLEVWRRKSKSSS